MAKGTAVPITPTVLTWAIREAGYRRDEDAAADLGVSAEVLGSWQTGATQPNLTEFRKLSAALRRSPATFLLPEPPEVPRPEVSFRHPPGAGRRFPNQEERLRLREAIRLQEVAKWIAQEADQAALIPRMGLGVLPASAADRARLLIEPHLPSSKEAWSTPSRAFDSWRSAFEALGALAFLFPMGEESAQGFSLADDWAPVIAVNTFWRDQARTFTMCHEFGHLITGTSSLCIEHAGDRTLKPNDAVERWCEEFAAALLLPAPAVITFLWNRFTISREDRVTTLDVANSLAKEFQVSVRAATLRLIELDMASWSLYLAIRPAGDRKQRGGSGEARDRDQQRQDRYGDRTFGLFMRALRSDLLGRSDVLDYLDITDKGLTRAQRAFPTTG